MFYNSHTKMYPLVWKFQGEVGIKRDMALNKRQSKSIPKYITSLEIMTIPGSH